MDGMGKYATFYYPQNVKCLNDTHILICDYSNGLLRLLKYEPTTEVKDRKTSYIHPKTTSHGLDTKIVAPNTIANPKGPESPTPYPNLIPKTTSHGLDNKIVAPNTITNPKGPKSPTPYPNLIPQNSIYFSRLKTNTGIAVTLLVGLGFTESYWLISLLISQSKKFKGAMYQIAFVATILHVTNLVFYTMVLDYQLSPYLMGDQQLGVWALFCGVMGNLINILIYWFITLRLYMFMKVI
jgi:hypothetical protein